MFNSKNLLKLFKYKSKNALPFGLLILLSCWSLALPAQVQNVNIVTLKEKGVVLVRLPTQKAKIKALEDLGKFEEAASLKAELVRSHEEITLVFKEKFTFCPVFFFYAENSGAIVDEGPGGFLMDATLEPVDLAPEYFIVAEFNRSPERGISGLVAYDSKLNPIPHPFPNFVRNHSIFFFWTRTKGNIVKRWNGDLEFYYSKKASTKRG